MASMVHEVQVTRLPLGTPSNNYRTFGSLNSSKFSPLELYHQLHENKSFPGGSLQIIQKQPRMVNVALQHPSNDMRSKSRTHSIPETFNQNNLQKPNNYIVSGKENKSILKKNLQTVCRRENSIYSLQKERPRSVPCSPRKVDFQPSVIVFHFDRIEGSHVRSESQILTTEPKDRKKFLNRNQTKMRFSTSMRLLSTKGDLDSSQPSIHIILPQKSFYQPSSNHLTIDQFSQEETPNIKLSTPRYRSSTPMPISRKTHASHKTIHSPPSAATISQGSANLTRCNSRSHSSLSEGFQYSDDIPHSNINEVDFTFFADDSCRLWLQFVVDLGAGVSASDVLVKANLAGNRVRIVGTRSLGNLKEEFHERCTLPMEVDPHMVTARMDGEGKLFVEGLIMTPEQKKNSYTRKSVHLN